MTAKGNLPRRTASPMRELFATALLVLALAACGTSDVDETAASSSAAAESAAQAAEESAAAEAEAEAEAAAASSRAAEESAAAAKAAEESEAAAKKEAEEEAKAEAERKKRIDDAKPATERELALVAKDPDAAFGDIMVVYGEITQFDSATGKCTFRANIAHQNMADTWDYDHNAIFMAVDSDEECPILDDVIADDEVEITATVMGAFSYDTQIGGSTTVPSFIVNEISLLN
ncbi:hypothetical protein [Zhihengliuella salsuginis]|uniref:Uncharacterized protein n=1 Tax=Zhihengliuella salsuginis TaxID=578222 RepID=A0ABQ3GH13_9MICC|nr:hypothetical protein [Zhihengliuella salsuginis]GHD06179.1 hypothetical protein GCM10008096_15840 [Zhihengliuella salsuginis]